MLLQLRAQIQPNGFSVPEEQVAFQKILSTVTLTSLQPGVLHRRAVGGEAHPMAI